MFINLIGQLSKKQKLNIKTQYPTTNFLIIFAFMEINLKY